MTSTFWAIQNCLRKRHIGQKSRTPAKLQLCKFSCVSYKRLLVATVLLLSTWFLGQDQCLRMSRTLHRSAPDLLPRPIDRRYGQEGWYPRHYPTMHLAVLDAGRIPDRKSASHCVMVMTTLHLGRGDRGKENAVSPP